MIDNGDAYLSIDQWLLNTMVSSESSERVVVEISSQLPPSEAIGEDLEENSVMATARRLLICFFGVFFSYLLYALVQEKIAKTDFGGEKFKFFGFLVFSQAIVNLSVAAIACYLFHMKPSMKPFRLYSFLALSSMGSMLASNSALAYITFPMQVLGKSCKPIPVLLLGLLFAKKKHHISKFFNVLLIVCGVALFMYSEHKKPKESEQSGWSLGFGEVLLVVSLFLDGLTGSIQDHLKTKRPAGRKIAPYEMMFSVNAWTILILGIGLLLTQEYVKAFGFISRHPEVTYNLFEFGITSAIGQIFIYQTITAFGPLTCSIITTTRKFFTILASVIVFGNSLITRQWIGVVLVFLGLGLDVYFSYKTRSAHSKHPSTTNTESKQFSNHSS